MALMDILKFEMSMDEVKTMSEFFKAKFKRSSIKKQEFEKLIIGRENVRRYNTKQARNALLKIKKAKSNISIEGWLKPELNGLFPNEVTLRGFKLAVYSLQCLPEQQVNNLAKFMDRRNIGFILLSDVDKALNSDDYSPVYDQK